MMLDIAWENVRPIPNSSNFFSLFKKRFTSRSLQLLRRYLLIDLIFLEDSKDHITRNFSGMFLPKLFAG